MSHADKADKLLIKPTAGARPASPCTPGRFIRKARTNGLTPDESQAARTTPPWQRPLTDRPADSHRRLSPHRSGSIMRPTVVVRRSVEFGAAARIDTEVTTMTSIAGELVTEAFEYDDGRDRH